MEYNVNLEDFFYFDLNWKSATLFQIIKHIEELSYITDNEKFIIRNSNLIISEDEIDIVFDTKNSFLKLFFENCNFYFLNKKDKDKLLLNFNNNFFIGNNNFYIFDVNLNDIKIKTEFVSYHTLIKSITDIDLESNIEITEMFFNFLINMNKEKISSFKPLKVEIYISIDFLNKVDIDNIYNILINSKIKFRNFRNIPFKEKNKIKLDYIDIEVINSEVEFKNILKGENKTKIISLLEYLLSDKYIKLY